MKRLEILTLAPALAVALGLMGWAGARREPEVVLARYVTSLKGRTPNQRHNVALATRTINGTVVPPGGTFSFNRRVGSWSSDSGYKRAPVSYDGELVPSWGGGVCQASTTLYNAALLAGLQVRERHRHRWFAHYVPPGRDAAVAYRNIDLRFTNPYAWPVRIEGEVRGELVEYRVIGREQPPDRYDIRQQVRSVTEPLVVRQPWREGLPLRRVRNPGKRGCRVLTYRVRMRNGQEVARELLSDDAYPAMNRLEIDPGSFGS
ncbi:MAG TPA: VanW family protein [Armatimonadota bacterium]|nr:VanW family protein [Armatimonadota bacterium]